MLAAIIGLLTSLPKILSLVKSVWAWLQKISGNDPAGFITRTNDAFTLLNKAKSEQEMIDAAKAIQAAIKGAR